MIFSLEGKLIDCTPTYSVVSCGGVGYQIHHSIHTYEHLREKEHVFVHTHLVVREDAQLLYGFANPQEKEMFLLLVSVSGVGPNTARLMLSHLQPKELVQAIGTGQVNVLKSVKGVGGKTAERIIVDLKDKVTAVLAESGEEIILQSSESKLPADALRALEVLGYPKAIAGKAIAKVIETDGDEMSLEALIKLTLKKL